MSGNNAVWVTVAIHGIRCSSVRETEAIYRQFGVRIIPETRGVPERVTA